MVNSHMYGITAKRTEQRLLLNFERMTLEENVLFVSLMDVDKRSIVHIYQR